MSINNSYLTRSMILTAFLCFVPLCGTFASEVDKQIFYHSAYFSNSAQFASSIPMNEHYAYPWYLDFSDKTTLRFLSQQPGALVVTSNTLHENTTITAMAGSPSGKKLESEECSESAMCKAFKYEGEEDIYIEIGSQPEPNDLHELTVQLFEDEPKSSPADYYPSHDRDATFRKTRELMRGRIESELGTVEAELTARRASLAIASSMVSHARSFEFDSYEEYAQGQAKSDVISLGVDTAKLAFGVEEDTVSDHIVDAAEEIGRGLLDIKSGNFASAKQRIVDNVMESLNLYVAIREMKELNKDLGAIYIAERVISDKEPRLDILNPFDIWEYSDHYISIGNAAHAKYLDEEDCSWFQQQFQACGFSSYNTDFFLEILAYYQNSALTEAYSLQSGNVYAKYFQDDTPSECPVAIISADSVDADAGEIVSVHGAKSHHPEDESFEFNWSLITPTGSEAEITNNGDHAHFVSDKAGVYTVKLVVDDGHCESTADTVEIFVDSSEAYEGEEFISFFDRVVSEGQCGEVIHLGQTTLGEYESWINPTMWGRIFSYDGLHEPVYLMASIDEPPSARSSVIDTCSNHGIASISGFRADFKMDMLDGTKTNDGHTNHNKTWNSTVKPGSTVYFAIGIGNNFPQKIKELSLDKNSEIQPPIPASCGTADGSIVTDKPDTHLCASNSEATSVNASPSSFSWSCTSDSGGETAQCEAQRSYKMKISKPSTGVSVNPDSTQLLQYGQITSIAVEPFPGREANVHGCGGEAQNLLEKTILDIGPIEGDCLLTVDTQSIPPAECGEADGNFLSEAPETNLCGPDSSLANGWVADGIYTWSWECKSMQGGTPADCAATRLYEAEIVDANDISNGSISPIESSYGPYQYDVWFDVVPDEGYRAEIGGSCGGSLEGDTYKTDPLSYHCSVEVEFVKLSYTVSIDSTAGVQISTDETVVDHGDQAQFTIDPETGYQIDSVSGCSGGALDGRTFKTDAIESDCSIFVTATPIDEEWEVTPKGEFDSIQSGGKAAISVVDGEAEGASMVSYPGDDPGDLQLDEGVVHFSIPEKGAFAGEYQIEVTASSGAREVITIDVPFRITTSSSELLGGLESAVLKVEGGAPGTEFTFLVVDKHGNENLDGEIATVEDAEPASDAYEAGNPARASVHASDVPEDMEFWVHATMKAGGAPESHVQTDPINALALIDRKGSVSNAIGEAVEDVTVRVLAQDNGEWLSMELQSGEPLEGQTNDEGIFRVPVPKSLSDLELLFLVSGYDEKQTSTENCGVTDPCHVMLDFATSAAGPEFDPPGGIFSNPTQVTISTLTDGATIAYVVDGSTVGRDQGFSGKPDEDVSILLDQDTEITAIAWKDGVDDSDKVSAQFEFFTAGPEIVPDGGVFEESPIEVKLSTETKDAIIIYTLDGSTPSHDNGVRSEQGEDVVISLEDNQELQAMAWRDGMGDSDIVSKEYHFDAGETDTGSADTESSESSDSSFGCAISASKSSDPLFVFLVFLSIASLYWRGRWRLPPNY